MKEKNDKLCLAKREIIEKGARIYTAFFFAQKKSNKSRKTCLNEKKKLLNAFK
jgi:hypothetical protein